MGVDLYTLWHDTIVRICKKTAKDFPEVTYDDLYQDLFLWVLETPQLKSPLQKQAVRVLEKQARHMAWEIRATFQYMNDRYLYRPSDVREIMKTAFDTSQWPIGFVPEDAWTTLAHDVKHDPITETEISQPVYDSTDRIVAQSDLAWAYSFLPENYKKILFRKYVLHEDFPSQTAELKMFYRAIDRLVFILNVYRKPPHEGPGSRRAVSNVHAQNLIDQEN